MNEDAWTQLEALDRRAEAARSKEAEARSMAGRAARKVAAAEADLAAYQEAVFGDERDEDDAEERRLIEAIAAAQAETSRTVADARSTAAARVRRAAEDEVRRFESEHFEELFELLAPDAYAATEELEEAHRIHVAAERRYGSIQHRSFRLAEMAGRTADDVPRHPLAGEAAEVEARFARGLEPPLPRSLVRARLERSA